MRARWLLSLCVLFAGCDLLGELEGFLSRPTQSEISGTARILAAETGCGGVEVRPVSATGVDTAVLTSSSCIVAGSYAHFWLLKTSSTTDVAIALESGSFAPYLALFPVDLQSETALVNEGVVDRNADGDGRAAFTSRITAGLYVVVVNTVFEQEVGDYSLTVERGN